ncbi:MAG: helix-turn-helix domain-containing protein, partial [Cyclobacteriaceae bacterium]
RKESREEEDHLSHEEALVDKLKRTVDKNIEDTKFNVSRLADTANLSERQLHRNLKRLTGLTPSQFIREIRLQKAMNYLEKNRYKTVSELAYAVGFENPGYFTKVFTQRFGRKPTEYIK